MDGSSRRLRLLRVGEGGGRLMRSEVSDEFARAYGARLGFGAMQVVPTEVRQLLVRQINPDSEEGRHRPLVLSPSDR
jgi:hypothetical protein